MQENFELKIRYLEMIQNIISRMASNSFALKGWTVTIVAGIFALSAKDAEMNFFLISYVPILLFWLLDAYYLQLERGYRELYNTSLQTKNNEINLSLTISFKGNNNYFDCLLSKTEIGFYLPLSLLLAFVIFLVTVHT